MSPTIPPGDDVRDATPTIHRNPNGEFIVTIDHARLRFADLTGLVDHLGRWIWRARELEQEAAK